jgi:uncharacterized Zn-binding protein involved in type VI secretion
MVDYTFPQVQIQQPDIGNVLRTVAVLKNADAQNRLAGLQADQLSESVKDKATLRGAVSRLAGGDQSARADLLGTTGGAEILKTLDAEKMRRVSEVAGIAHTILDTPAASRPAVYQAMRTLAGKRGLDVSSLPEEYNPSIDAHLQAAVGLGMTLQQQLEQGKGTVVPEGGRLVDRNGKVIAEGGAKTHTLSPGGQLVGGDGSVIATAPDRPQAAQHVTTKDGVFVLNRDGTLGTKLGDAPQKDAPGQFGNSLDGRAIGVLINGDPASPEYAAAFAHASAPRMMQTDQGMVSVTPDVSWARKPAQAGQQSPAAPGGAPAAGGQPSVSVVPGTERAPKFTNEQSTAAGFANRISAANGTLDQLEGGGYSPTNARDTLGGAVPGGNFIKSEKGQQYEQAKRDFVTAVLRKESGAAISTGEFVTEEKKYFPQPGDSGPVIAQKRQARERALQSMIVQSGEAYKTMFGGKKTASAGGQEYDYDPATKTLKPRVQ